jgi:hypothetical protein
VNCSRRAGAEHQKGDETFQGSRVSSHGGLILVRGLDERLGFADLIAGHLCDSRSGKNAQLPLADLFRQSVYGRMAGYEDPRAGPNGSRRFDSG